MASRIGIGIKGRYLDSFQGRKPAARSFALPDSSRRQALAINHLFELYPDPTRWLLWVSEWGVWPSEEYPEVWDQLRAYHGEARPLIEAPGHLLEENERPLARGLARLAMLFGWDFFLIPEPFSFLVFVSHDEMVDLYAATQAAVKKVAAAVEEVWPGLARS